jgi:hypothetical protein
MERWIGVDLHRSNWLASPSHTADQLKNTQHMCARVMCGRHVEKGCKKKEREVECR